VPDYPQFRFDVTGRDPAGSRARTGRLGTPHGVVETPNFIFCGTKAAMKGVLPGQMHRAGSQIILSNTYHLMIQPGAEIIAALGGLHGFMGWDGPMLTDSGGFQIFSMGHGGVADEIKGRRRPPSEAALIGISEEGARFRSYRDGSPLFLSPEGSIDIQRKLGADLIVVLDECTPFHVERAYTAQSMALTHRWGDRCLAEFDRGDDGRQALYGIIQGGVYADLRQESATYTRDRPYFGTAIGGSLGGEAGQMRAVVAETMRHVHPDRPVHLLGIGGIADILDGVAMGIDTFDSVQPTRVGRHGWALRKGGARERVNLRNARFRSESGPIDESCGCETCATFAAGYLHHLLRADELLAITLLSIHNVYTMNRLMRDIRDAIAAGALAECRRAWLGAASADGEQEDDGEG
jgi:queuine tRNA-ribosyltransferase